MNRKLLVAAILTSSVMAGLVASSPAMAQEEPREEVAVQGTGFFTKDSSGNGIQQRTTETGGFILSYRYRFNSWLAADGSYGYDRNTLSNVTTTGALGVQSDVHQATAALVVSAPRIFHLKPYVLAGAGALVFDPTTNAGGFVPGAATQAKAAFVYGGGVDYDLTRHLALRAEYRGFVYGEPDFGLQAIHSGATTHTAEPSAGVVFRF